MKRLLRILFLFLATAAGSEPFSCMVALTRQDSSMDWWYAVPEPFTPKITQISSVAKGEYFDVVPFFSQYAVDTNGQARITFDIEVVRPGGSIDIGMESCEGYAGTTATNTLLASRAVLHLCFDPEDPFGDYTINVTAVDQVAQATNRQSVVIKQKAFAIQPTTEAERDALFTRYPVAPDPSLALSSFLQTEHSFLDAESEPVWSAIWFFKTVFENNDYLMPHLLAAFPDATSKQKEDIILVLALMEKTDGLPRLNSELRLFERGMKTGRVPKPYEEITTGKQLDMLWAEYFATGRIKPVRQIVSALQLGRYTGTLEKIKAGELDPENPEVYRDGTREAVFQSALWSLRTNFRTSPLLYAYCAGILNEEKPGSPVQATLALLMKSVDL